MDINKFLEAQNLRNQINYLEKCLNEFLKKENAVIGISWSEARTEMNYSGGTAWTTNTRTENHVEILPTELQEQVKELIEDELDALKQEFEML